MTTLAEAIESLQMALATRCDACDGCEYADCSCDFLEQWRKEAQELVNKLTQPAGL